MHYKRKIFKKVLKHLDNKEHTILIGARQTGKTTLLYLLKDELTKKGKKSFFLNLEDPDYLNSLNERPSNIFSLIPKPEGNEKIYLFIDEIQYLKNPTNFLKWLYDEYNGKIKAIVSGSSAFYIDRKFKDSLIGRKRIFIISTLSFFDFLIFKERVELQKYLIPENKTPKIYLDEIKILFTEYKTYGGYPQVVLEKLEDKHLVLNEIVSSYIKKDALDAGVRKEEHFFRLIRILAAQAGSLINVNELANTLQLSVTAINNFIYILQKSFIIQSVSPFHNNIRSELTKMSKAYFLDTGLLNFINKTLDLNNDSNGILTENLAFLQLQKKDFNRQIYFWRTAQGQEVDFILEDEKLAYEVKSNVLNIKSSKYKLFNKLYPEYTLNIATNYVAQDSINCPFDVVEIWNL